MEIVNKLKRVFNSKNRFTIPDQIFELIELGAKAYIPANKQTKIIRKKRKHLFYYF
jgi:hypothetical protein